MKFFPSIKRFLKIKSREDWPDPADEINKNTWPFLLLRSKKTQRGYIKMNNASPQKGLAADPRILMKIGYIIPQFTNSCSSLILFCHPLVRVGGGSVEQPHGCRIGWDQTWRKDPGCGLRHRQPDADRQGLVEIYRVLKPGGRIFLADFNPPANPVLAHITTAFVGHGMMQTNLLQLPAMLAEAGFLDISSGGTRSAFLSFVSGRKPAS